MCKNLVNLKFSRQITTVLVAGVLLFSCAGEKRREEEISSVDEYFPVQDLLAETREQMLEMNVKLQKTASFSGETEKSVIVPDSSGLVKELEVFREIDINKPVFSGRYQESREKVNGQEVIIYKADDPETLNIHYLKVYKNPENGMVEQLEALFSSKNVLYKSSRQVSLTFEPVKDENLPKSYNIKGSQKMIFSNEENYMVEANFIYQE